jgi:hypothetical protein
MHASLNYGILKPLSLKITGCRHTVWKAAGMAATSAHRDIVHFQQHARQFSLATLPLILIAKTNSHGAPGLHQLIIRRYIVWFADHFRNRDGGDLVFLQCHHPAKLTPANALDRRHTIPGRQDSVEGSRCSTPLQMAKNSATRLDFGALFDFIGQFLANTAQADFFRAIFDDPFDRQPAANRRRPSETMMMLNRFPRSTRSRTLRMITSIS